jgi:hypothetical protein
MQPLAEGSSSAPLEADQTDTCHMTAPANGTGSIRLAPVTAATAPAATAAAAAAEATAADVSHSVPEQSRPPSLKQTLACTGLS